MICALFAIDESGGVGLNGGMPWPFNKEDMFWFKRITEGHVVVMGKNSWDSPDMPKPLPKRINVVVTNKLIERKDIIQIKGNVCEELLSLEKNYPGHKIFVIGGANLLEQAKPILSKVYITRIPGNYNSDVKINITEFLQEFKLVNFEQFTTCKVEEYETVSRST